MPTDSIDDIITDVLKAEGWDKYTNHPNDKGGPTKWGITEKAWLDYVKGTDYIDPNVRNITEVQARTFYYTRYIHEPNFQKLPPLLMELVVDCGVNHGTNRASKWVQKAVGVTEDGRIGPQTLAAVEVSNKMAVYLNICAYRVRFYGAIVGRDHTQAEFISGWNNRAAKWLVSLADLIKSG